MNHQKSININKDGKLNCITLINPLRVLAGKRIVFEAMWEGQTVLVKVFAKKKHWLREEKGLGYLSKFSLRSPACLFSGEIVKYTHLEQYGIAFEEQLYVLILEFYKEAESFRALWRSTALSTQHRTILFSKLLVLIAEHHGAGVVQKDLHLGNFLVVKESLVAIDGDAIDYIPSLSVKECKKQLGILLAQSFPRYDSLLESLLFVYFKERELILDVEAIEDVVKNRNIAREIAKKNWLNKIYRESTQFHVLKTFMHHVCIDRSFINTEFSARIMGLIDNDKEIVEWSDEQYEYQATLYVRCVKLAGRWLKENEASNEWKEAQLKVFFGEQITQQPVALVLKALGPFHLSGYFVQATVLGVNL